MPISYNSFNEKIFLKTLRTNSFISLDLAGITYPSTNYKIYHNTCKQALWDKYVIEYVVSGKGYIETPEKTYVVKGGDLYFLNKFKQHIYYPDKTDPYEKKFICFKGTFADSLINSFNINESEIIKHVDANQNFDRIFSLIDTENDVIDLDLFSVELLKLVQLLKNHINYEEGDNDLAQFVKNYLNQNICEKINLNKISEDLFISKSHIERVFVKKYGISPMDYFKKIKITYACSILITTKDSLTDIANHISMNDPKYLSKCIKKQTGLSPNEYRKKYRKNKLD